MNDWLGSPATGHPFEPRAVPLRMGEVHVWFASPAASDRKCESMYRLLDDEERARAERFHRLTDRRLYVTSRGLLRSLLGNYTKAEPEAVCFRFGRQGKPELLDAHNSLGIRFNLSHSRDRIVCAFALGAELGVDVEAAEPLPDLLNIARRFFSTAELAAIEALHGLERVAAFYRCWTRKEAYLKATGVGITNEFSGFSVPVAAIHGAHPIGTSCSQETSRDWRLWDLPIDKGYIASLAISGKDWKIRCARTPDAALCVAGIPVRIYGCPTDI